MVARAHLLNKALGVFFHAASKLPHALHLHSNRSTVFLQLTPVERRGIQKTSVGECSR
jgi:hypothetical protein